MVANGRLVLATLLVAMTAGISACSEKRCEDFCGVGNTCDASGRCVPLACEPACGLGQACQLGACVVVAAVRCTAQYPGCAACDTTLATPAWVSLCGSASRCNASSDRCEPAQVAATCTETYPGCARCDTSAATPAWVSKCGAGTRCETATDACVPLPCSPACGPGTACQMGQCVPVAAVSCAATYPGCASCDTGRTPPEWVAQCGAGTRCDTATDACVPLSCSPACGPGTACQMGQCVPVAAVTCAAPYPGCASCDTSRTPPAWVPFCGVGSTCDLAGDRCVGASTAYHASLGAAGKPLAGPFPNAFAVTTACIGCHANAAADVMATPHWQWAGNTPDLVAPDQTTTLNPGTIGKKNLVNNFCVATPSNDKRCDQCHAGYGGDPDTTKPQKSARAYLAAESSVPLQSRVDCLVCHASPTTGYAKDPKNFGNPTTASNLVAAAQNIIKPNRTNCGACHFYAGGGDNVKLMGSALKNPSESLDVHMGRGMDCVDCHAGPRHTVRGAGVHVPTHNGRVGCSECHTNTPHEGRVAMYGELFDLHTAKLACQTCHIPAYSRGQFAKVDWDWSTAGDNKTCAGTPGACVAGAVSNKVNDDGSLNPASTSSVVHYDYLKGNFVWKRSVTPAYRWSNGKATHARLSDRWNLGTLGTTAVDSNRISLGEPLGSPTNGKIMPFKVMRGRQAFYVNGAESFAITPNLFGPQAFWGIIQAAGFDPTTYDFDGAAGPIAPGTASMEALLGKIFAVGSIAAGQVPAGTPPFARYLGTGAGYDWRYTKLYMDLNHEIAPAAQALGANGGCSTCHSNNSGPINFCELYNNAPPPILAITCP